MRDLKAKRVVVKIGTNTICKSDGTVDRAYIEDVARQVVELERKGVQSIVVTSGAIGSGSSELGLDGRQKDISMKQACAAVGQALLMMAWRDAFRDHGKSVGQVLLTYGAFSKRDRYLNLRKAIDSMFCLGAIPVVNENDVIATDEIEDIFGDNDKLSALVASKMDADLLILLTDVDGLYDRNPEADKDARLIPTVDEITKDIERIAGSRKNERSTGGMRTKINAAKIAMESGCNMVIANGRLENVIVRVADGEEIGTLFTARSQYTNKERWILFACPLGKIEVDEGAERALRSGNSLLPCGILSVEGKFKKGDVVRIGTFAKGIVNLSSAELRPLVDACLRAKAEGRKNGNGHTAVSSENIVIHE
ncbi:glutamate 5-kinase [Methanomassiliicoccus luminyensis]|uniref:glutamate 5-kinase n=1 Tax=Methanomassiliicoccus luminyensis TaxID=1080712 RepID=UPI00036E6469|nr:glutamate 5-kinase [Methanomassiliicoccus luminyensis]